MKVRDERPFWSQRPARHTRRLELSCWLAAGVLALALGQATGSHADVPLQPAVAAPTDSFVVQRRCVKRVTDLTLHRQQLYVIQQLTRQCFGPQPRAAAVDALPATCRYSFTLAPALVRSRVAGCLGQA